MWVVRSWGNTDVGCGVCDMGRGEIPMWVVRSLGNTDVGCEVLGKYRCGLWGVRYG